MQHFSLLIIFIFEYTIKVQGEPLKQDKCCTTFKKSYIIHTISAEQIGWNALMRIKTEIAEKIVYLHFQIQQLKYVIDYSLRFPQMRDKL
jgi:hypothetical protein